MILAATRCASLATLLALAGCATSYGPTGIGGGFSETRRADDIYVIHFRGNGYTKPEQVEEMAFLRAAELTIEKGFRYFVILGESGSTDSTVVAMPGQSFTTGSINPYGGFQARTTSIGGMPLMVRMPSARLHIGLAHEKFSQERTFYEARAIVDNLRPKYKR
jgi:hypothetical protein